MDPALSPFSPFVDPHNRADHSLARTITTLTNQSTVSTTCPLRTGQLAIDSVFSGAVLVRIFLLISSIGEDEHSQPEVINYGVDFR